MILCPLDRLYNNPDFSPNKIYDLEQFDFRIAFNDVRRTLRNFYKIGILIFEG